MPFDSVAELTTWGRRFNAALFGAPPPRKPYTGFEWSPVGYLMNDPAHSGTRYYVEAILAYCANVQDHTQLEPFGRLMGASVWGLRPYGNPFTPNFIWFVMPQVKYIAFAGTTNWLQWIRNVLGAVQVPPREPLLNNIAQTWKIAAETVLPDVAAVLGPTVENEWFILAGHSLGAVTAEVVSRYLFQFYRWAARRVVTFGGPRCGDRGWGANGFPPLFRCVREGDPVTQLPVQGGIVSSVLSGAAGLLTGVANFEHTRSDRSEVDPHGSLSSAGNDRSGANGVASTLWTQLIGDSPPAPHRLKTYIDSLRSNRFTLNNPAGPFITALETAHVALRKELNDWP